MAPSKDYQRMPAETLLATLTAQLRVGGRAGRVPLERGLPALLAEQVMVGGSGLKLAELHEEVQSCLNQGGYARAWQVTQGALRKKLTFVPIC